MLEVLKTSIVYWWKIKKLLLPIWENSALFLKYKKDPKLACNKVKAKYFYDLEKEIKSYVSF